MRQRLTTVVSFHLGKAHLYLGTLDDSPCPAHAGSAPHPRARRRRPKKTGRGAQSDPARVPGGGRPDHRRGHRRQRGMEQARRAHRRIRPSALRQRRAGAGHRLDHRSDEIRGTGERPGRAGDGAEMGARPREGRAAGAALPQPADAGARPERGYAERRCTGRGAGGLELRRPQGKGRPGRAGRSCSSTCPSPTTARRCSTAAAGRSKRPRSARWRCCSARSGPFGMRTPHTGSMQPYDSTVRKIAAAAITMEDAAMLHRMQDRGQKIVVRLEMEAQMMPDSPSRNVVGELVGRERPDEVVVFGGHIDSWDVGTGAMDDAGGVVIAWEAVRLLQKLGLRPAAHDPGGGMDQRGERRARGSGVPGPAPERARQARRGDRVRRRHLQVPWIRVYRERLRIRDRAIRSPGCSSLWAPIRRARRRRRRRHRPDHGAGGPRALPTWWTAPAISGITIPKPTTSTRSTRRSWPKTWPPWRSWRTCSRTCPPCCREGREDHETIGRPGKSR